MLARTPAPCSTSRRISASSRARGPALLQPAGARGVGVVGGEHPSENDTATTEIEERRVGKECRSRWSPYHFTGPLGAARRALDPQRRHRAGADAGRLEVEAVLVLGADAHDDHVDAPEGRARR